MDRDVFHLEHAAYDMLKASYDNAVDMVWSSPSRSCHRA